MTINRSFSTDCFVFAENCMFHMRGRKVALRISTCRVLSCAFQRSCVTALPANRSSKPASGLLRGLFENVRTSENCSSDSNTGVSECLMHRYLRVSLFRKALGKRMSSITVCYSFHKPAPFNEAF